VREWLSSALSNLILCRNAKQPSNNTTFLCRNGHLLPCQIWFYARMVAFSPVKIQLYDRMVIFLHCQISSLSASLGHFPTSGLTGSRSINQNGYLLARFYVGMIILSPIKFNSMTETSSLSTVKVQGSLSLTHILTPLGHSTSNWLGQELYAGIINFRYQNLVICRNGHLLLPYSNLIPHRNGHQSLLMFPKKFMFPKNAFI